MKKILALSVSAALILVIFTACSSKNNTVPTVITTTSASVTQKPTEEFTVEIPEKTEPSVTEKNIVQNSDEQNRERIVAEAPDAEPEKNSNTTQRIANYETKITKDEAKIIALNDAELKESDISRYKSELDIERNVLVYEIEFDAGKFEYDYEVDAQSGKILKSEKEYID